MQANQTIKKYAWPLAIGAGVLFLFARNNEAKRGVKTAQKELEQNTEAASYTLTSYANLADSLQAAMVDVGTDEARVYSVFKKMKNAKDLLLLIKAFGVRPYYNFGIKQGDYNLAQWLTIELNDDELTEVNTILQKANINFAF